MLVPSLFNNNFVDDFFDDMFNRTPQLFKASGNALMNADIKELKDHYEMELELPGFKKEDIHASLKDGYLTIDAERKDSDDQKDEKDGKYIRRERYVGKIERSFYVGEDVKQEDIKAAFDNGILTISIPKKEEEKPQIEEAKHIAIE